MALPKSSIQKIERIVADFTPAKPNFSQLALKHGVSRTTIRNYYQKYLARVPFNEFRRPGRPPRIQKSHHAWIGRRASNRAKRLSTAALAEEIRSTFGVIVSPETIRRKLRSLGYRSAKPVVKPLLTAAHKEKRVSWCKDNAQTDWNSVLFTDEASFEVGGWKGRQWCRRGTRPIVEKMKFPHKVMVWGGISSKGKTPLFFIDGTLTGSGYIELLRTHYLPWKRSKRIAGLIFQQDNAPCHTAKVGKAFMDSKRMQVLDWPPNSPDLNPIENLWAHLKFKVAQRAPTTKEELKRVLVEEWESISQEAIDKFIGNMSDRIYACMFARGGHTNF